MAEVRGRWTGVPGKGDAVHASCKARVTTGQAASIAMARVDKLSSSMEVRHRMALPTITILPSAYLATSYALHSPVRSTCSVSWNASANRRTIGGPRPELSCDVPHTVRGRYRRWSGKRQPEIWAVDADLHQRQAAASSRAILCWLSTSLGRTDRS